MSLEWMISILFLTKSSLEVKVWSCVIEGDVWSMALSLTRCLILQERHQDSDGLSEGSKRDKARVLACLGLAHGYASRTWFR
jgi:hypothetical protein